MIETLNHIDTQIFLFLNSLHNSTMDSVMLTLSYSEAVMGFLLLGLIGHSVLIYKRKAFAVVFFAILAFGLSDSISSRIFKPGFKRLRPCHQKVLEDKVHLAGRKCWGGKYGFVSSHAANSFALATFFFLALKSQWYYLLFLHAGLVSYSRIYLAKHFPGDIFFGALLGAILGFLSFKLCRKLFLKDFSTE